MRRSPCPSRGRFAAGRRAAATLVTAVLMTAGVTACSKAGPSDTLDDFIAGWKRGANMKPMPA